MTAVLEPSRPGQFWLVFLWSLEIAGILIGAGSSFRVTFGNHPPDHVLDWFVAAPMVALATIELMRIYLARSFCYHTNVLLRLAAAIGLVFCIGVAFENWTIGIEGMVDWRFRDIEQRRESVRAARQRIADQEQANHEREAKREKDAVEAQATLDKNAARLSEIDAALKAKAEEHLRLMKEIKDGCLKIPGECLRPKTATEQERYKAEADALTEEHRTLKTENSHLQQSLRQAREQGAGEAPAAIKALKDSLLAEERELAREANGNVLNRLIASFFAVAPEKLDDKEFQQGRMVFSMFSAMALSASITIGALAYYWPKRLAKRQSRLSRALRAYLARKRKPVVRTVTEKVEVDRIVEKPVPAVVIEKPIRHTRTVVKFVPYTGQGPLPADVETEAHEPGPPVQRVIEDAEHVAANNTKASPQLSVVHGDHP
jgi:hypothetical protein